MAELRLSRALQSGIAVYRRMAGTGRRPAFPAGSRYPSPVRRRSAHGGAVGAHAGGRSLARLGAFALGLFFLVSAQAQIISTRIWPAKDYTRVTLESKAEI